MSGLQSVTLTYVIQPLKDLIVIRCMELDIVHTAKSQDDAINGMRQLVIAKALYCLKNGLQHLLAPTMSASAVCYMMNSVEGGEPIVFKIAPKGTAKDITVHALLRVAAA